MAKLTEEELKSLIEWTDTDVKAHIYIPNDIFEMLAKDEELNKSNGTRKSTHVAEAYCYLVAVTYLYRNCKYGWMQDASMKALQTIVGFNYDYKKFNYVIKKDGVLDKLGLTKTISVKDIPVEWHVEDKGFLILSTQEEIDAEDDPRNVKDRKDLGIIKNVKNAKVKEPQFALYDENGEYGLGTFFGYTEKTHKVDMEVFIECMTNEDLGCTAFYLYSFLTWKCATSQGTPGSIEIALDTIGERTGVLRGARDKALHGLKAHNLINCIPAPFIVGANKGEGSNIYSVNGMRSFTEQAKKYTVRTLIPVKAVEVKSETTLNKKKEVIEKWQL